MKRRIFSLLLALCMVLSLLPATALATETETTETLFTVSFGTLSTVEAKADSVQYLSVTNTAVTPVDSVDGAWNVGLDTTGEVPELTLKDLTFAGTTTNAKSVPALKVTSSGDINIVVDGTNTISHTGYHTLQIAVTGTTTITSTTGGTLNATATSTSAYNGINSSGDVVFKNVNIVAGAKTYRSDGAGATIYAAGSITIDGGSVTAKGAHNSVMGISSAKSITVQNFAKVKVENSYIGNYANSTYNTNIANNPDAAHKNSKGVVTCNVGDRPRYAISAKAITIDCATVEVIDASTYVTTVYGGHVVDGTAVDTLLYNEGYTVLRVYTGNYEYAFSTTPTLTNVEAKYSASADGSSLQDLDVTDQEALSNPYVLIQAICPAHEHDGVTDTNCNVCGAERDVPKDITVAFQGLATTGYNITWAVAPGQIYYATTTSSAFVNAGVLRVDDSVAAVPEGFTELTAEPAWNIKLDNTKAVAELTLKDVAIAVPKYNSKQTNGITVSGSGALKIIVDGTTDSSVETVYGVPLVLAMTEGTTITSTDNQKLSLTCSDSGGFTRLTSAGDLLLENANLYVKSNSAGQWNNARAISLSAGDMTVKNSTLEVVAGPSAGSTGLYVNAGQLKITDGSNVTVTKTSQGPDAMLSNSPQYAVYASGGVDFDGGRLVITDSGRLTWEGTASGDYEKAYANTKYNYIINVNPDITSLVAAGDSVVVMGNKADEEVAELTLPLADINEYRYLSFQYVCGEHAYDNDYDLICNKCGEERDCPEHTGGTATCSQLAVCDICNKGYGLLKDHEYDNEYDGICNVCGQETREAPKDVTVKVATTGNTGVNNLPKADEATYVREITVKPGEVLYAVADANGYVTSFAVAETAPEGWDFMLDNTKVVAELIFDNGAFLQKRGELKTRLEDANGDAILKDGNEQYTVAQKLLAVTGDGALKVIVRSDTKLESAYDTIFAINMTKGTTITSENNSLLTLPQEGASGVCALNVNGNLTLDHANIVATTKRSDLFWGSGQIVTVTGAMEIIGGRLDIAAISNTNSLDKQTNGNKMLTVSGALTLKDYAWVNIHVDTAHVDQFYGNAAGKAYRSGVSAASITINNSSLYIVDNNVLSPAYSGVYANTTYTVAEHYGMLDYAINAWPVELTGAKAYYRASLDDSELQTLTAETATQLVYGPSGAIEFPYVAFIADCDHDGAKQTDCTVAVNCSICQNELYAAKAHEAEADDGDCTTPVKCANCDQIAIAAKAHEAEADDGDCTTPVKCANCDQIVIAAKAHEAGEDDGDCATPVQCANCDQIAIAAKAHSYTYTDNGDGTHLVKCANDCNYSKNEACTDEDEDGVCDDCEAALECKHATASVVKGYAATCVTPGMTDGEECADCGETLVAQQTIPVDENNHVNLQQVDAKAPTCTENGHNAYEYCDACGHSTAVVDPATNHANAYEVEGEDATCTEAGKTAGTYCPDCETWTVPQEEIPATNHANAYEVEGEDATCTEAGKTAGTYCPDCETWTVPQEEIPATNHSYTEYVSNNDATCTKDGTKTAECDNGCGEKSTVADEGSATGHAFDDEFDTECNNDCGETREAATYADAITSNGDTHGTITAEGAVVTIKATGTINHLKGTGTGYGWWIGFRINTPENIDAADVTITRPDGATRNLKDILDSNKTYASMYYNLGAGMDVKYLIDWNSDGTTDLTVVIDGNDTVLVHKYTSVVTDPTCTEAGYTTYTCGCGDTYNDDYVDALGHKYDNEFDATCNVCGEDRVAKTAVAQVGDDKFETLAEAIAAGGEVKLLDNLTVAGYVNINNAITLNLNGKTITRAGTSGNDPVLYVTADGAVIKNGAVTITGNGIAIWAAAKTEIDDVTVTGADVGILAQADVTVKNSNVVATVITDAQTESGDGIRAYRESVVNIVNSTITGSASGSAVEVYASAAITVDETSKVLSGGENYSAIVYGGTLTVNGTAGAICISNDAEAAAAATVKGTDLNVTTTIADSKVVCDNGVYTVVAKDYVAQVGDDKFETLAEAIAAGGEVKLLADIKLDALIKVDGTALAIDLNGKTISRDKGTIFYVVGGGELNVKNGTVTTAGQQAIAIYSVGDGDTKNKITLDGVTVNSEYFGVYHNGTKYGVDVTINDSNITDTLANGSGVYLSGSETWGADKLNTLTITDSTISGATAVEVKSTDATITGSTLIATGSESIKDNVSGACTTGYAFALTNNGAEDTKGVLELSRNTYTGKVGVKANTTVDVVNNGTDAVEAPEGYCWNASGVLGVHAAAESSHNCAHCGEKASEHNSDGIVDHKNATCTENGVEGGTYCTVCGKGKEKAEAVITAPGHTAGDAVQENVTNASCTVAGSYESVVYCSACGEELSRATVTGETLPHTEVIDEAVEATCTEDGKTEGKHCSDCGDVLVSQETVPATGHAWDDEFDATCNVCGEDRVAKTAVAQVGDDKYESLKAAIEAAKGQTITLLGDVYIGALTIDQAVVIDLDGKALTIKGTDGATAAITITENGSFDVNGGNLKITGTNTYETMIVNNGTLTVTDMIVRIDAMAGNTVLANNKNATATIAGDTIFAAKTASGVAIVNEGTCIINIVAAEGSTRDVRIQGAINQIDGSLTLTKIELNGKLNYTAGNVTRSSEEIAVSAPGSCWKNNVLGKHEAEENSHYCGYCEGMISNHKYVAGNCSVCGDEQPGAKFITKVGTTRYTTLEAAIAAAKGQTITLLSNVYTGALTIDQAVVIDLDGKALTIKGTDGATAAITITENGSFDVNGGNLKITGANTYETMIVNNGTLTVTDMIVRIDAMAGDTVLVNNKNATATITGKTVFAAKTASGVAIVNKGTCEIATEKTVDVSARVQGAIKTVENGVTKSATTIHYGRNEIISAN